MVVVEVVVVGRCLNDVMSGLKVSCFYYCQLGRSLLADHKLTVKSLLAIAVSSLLGVVIKAFVSRQLGLGRLALRLILLTVSG